MNEDTPDPWWRIEHAIARHESRQLRRHPVHQWPAVTVEARAARLLAWAHGALVPCAPMRLEPRERCAPLAPVSEDAT